MPIQEVDPSASTLLLKVKISLALKLNMEAEIPRFALPLDTETAPSWWDKSGRCLHDQLYKDNIDPFTRSNISFVLHILHQESIFLDV